ncbi:hypothetical protein MBAV_005061 [Candidatus Magnetobacterium bavaricum]|uniref:Uncharacterized protein n=1 Tax=Candidatus Magnetobacterium bavaricum TaxID=29290 RepID=A0A0F3GLH4_9BACT|nr:hypothetical protein MBAV_005061 [Candidatus Magnetobacterium bavaricum]
MPQHVPGLNRGKQESMPFNREIKITLLFKEDTKIIALFLQTSGDLSLVREGCCRGCPLVIKKRNISDKAINTIDMLL